MLRFPGPGLSPSESRAGLWPNAKPNAIDNSRGVVHRTTGTGIRSLDANGLSDRGPCVSRLFDAADAGWDSVHAARGAETI
jgi:hypothetical protein